LRADLEELSPEPANLRGSRMPFQTVGRKAAEGPFQATRLHRELSIRERQVVGLIVNGLTNREIAQKLDIAEGTAANHVWHVLNKLGLNSRTQIAVWAVRHGFLLS
jgi:non-specific serine/threonine protein kinase